MFSFEGQYKKPRSINYSKQKDIGKKDLIENARQERKKRALLNQQIASAEKIQKSYRSFLSRKKKKAESYRLCQQTLSQLSPGNSNDPIFHELIHKSINYLLIYFDCSPMDHSLKSVITLLNSEDVIHNLPIRNFYYAIDICLLIRLTSRYLKSLPENSNSVNYNIYLRFFEIFFAYFNHKNDSGCSSHIYHRDFLHIFLKSHYFSNMTEFINKQLLFRNDTPQECYNQRKVKFILDIVLRPITDSISHDLFDLAIIQFINNIYSSPKTSFGNSIKALKFMNIALLDVVTLDTLIDIIFRNIWRSDKIPYLDISSGLLLLILNSVVDIKLKCLTPLIAAKTLLLFFKISRKLFDSNKLVLSNDLPDCEMSQVYLYNRDDLDFEMNDIERNSDLSEDDEDESLEESNRDSNSNPVKKMSVVEQEIAMILKTKFCQIVVPQATQIETSFDDQKSLYDSIGYLYHLLILETKIIGSSESKTFILNLIQTSKIVSRRLWSSVVEQKTTKDSESSLMQSLINGQIKSIDNDIKEFFGKLLCFANCLHWRLLSVQDLDLIKIDSEDSSRVIEFSPNELCDIVLKLRDIMYGLILLIYPSTSTSINPGQRSPVGTNEKLVKMFIELQRVVVRLYNRDIRKGLKVSNKRLEWIKPEIPRINVTNLKRNLDLFENKYKFGMGNLSNNISPSDWRQIVILKEMPFIIPIGVRMKLFKERIIDMTSPNTAFSMRTPIKIRRDYLYEDAFNQITKKFDNIRTNLKIEFIDRFGMNEVGVDGGGLLREFLTSIIKESCDPKRGLFVSTKNNLLYPNPELETLYPDNWRDHLFFFGRMLGLIIFKGLLVEAPFAPFFIRKLFNNNSSREEIDIDNLQSLDEDLYRNLLSLKSMEKVEDINLDFTVSRSCYGMSKIVELKPNGEHIAVTNFNKIEYIYLVADYKLNRQISPQTALIISGLSEVVPIEYFQLFDLDEISFIITGGGSQIDVVDLQRNTIYHGVDDPDSSKTIKNFWTVVFQMTEDEKRSFIQFVTSISRAPMLGFGELTPKFAIQIVPDIDRLPTASTCINLLKLPAYESLEEMRQKLLYAIGSDSGFHLS